MADTSETEEMVPSQPRPAIRLLVILTVAAVLVAVGVWVVDPPKYRSKAYIEIGSPFPKRPMEFHEAPVSGELMSRYVSDQAMMVKDDRVLQAVLTNSDVISTRWYASQRDKVQMLEDFRNTLRAEAAPGTSFVVLSFPADHPQDSAVIVNTVLAKYVELVQERSQLDAKSELQDYLVKEKDLKDRLNTLLDRRKRFLTEQPADSGSAEDLDLIREPLRALTAEANRIQQEKLRAKTVYEHLNGQSPEGVSLSPALHVAIEQDPEVTNLRQLKLALEIELESVQATQPESRPADDIMRRKLKVVERKLNELLARKEGEVRKQQLDSTKAEYLALAQQEATLREQILELQAKKRDADQARVQLENLDAQKMQLIKEIDKIREFTNQLDLMIKERGMVRVRPILAMKSVDRDIDSQLRTSIIALAIPLAYGFLLLLIRLVRGPRSATTPIEKSNSEV